MFGKKDAFCCSRCDVLNCMLDHLPTSKPEDVGEFITDAHAKCALGNCLQSAEDFGAICQKGGFKVDQSGCLEGNEPKEDFAKHVTVSKLMEACKLEKNTQHEPRKDPVSVEKTSKYDNIPFGDRITSTSKSIEMESSSAIPTTTEANAGEDERVLVAEGEAETMQSDTTSRKPMDKSADEAESDIPADDERVLVAEEPETSDKGSDTTKYEDWWFEPHGPRNEYTLPPEAERPLVAADEEVESLGIHSRTQPEHPRSHKPTDAVHISAYGDESGTPAENERVFVGGESENYDKGSDAKKFEDWLFKPHGPVKEFTQPDEAERPFVSDDEEVKSPGIQLRTQPEDLTEYDAAYIRKYKDWVLTIEPVRPDGRKSQHLQMRSSGVKEGWSLSPLLLLLLLLQ